MLSRSGVLWAIMLGIVFPISIVGHATYMLNRPRRGDWEMPEQVQRCVNEDVGWSDCNGAFGGGRGDCFVVDAVTGVGVVGVAKATSQE